jgi:hypothetical protein
MKEEDLQYALEKSVRLGLVKVKKDDLVLANRTRAAHLYDKWGIKEGP